MRFILIVLVMLLSLQTVAAEQTWPYVHNEDEMGRLVKQFVAQQDKIANEQELTLLADLLHDSFRYYHPHFSINYPKSKWLDAMRLKFKHKPQTRFVNTQIITVNYALNAAYVQQQSEWEQEVNGKWFARNTTKIVSLFEFKDGKISAIREYW